MTNPSLLPSTVTPPDLRALAEEILRPAELTSSSQLLTRHECSALIEACERIDPPPSPDQINEAVRMIVGSYPSGKPADPDMYLAMVSRVFADYPARFVREVAEELPRSSKWLPQIFEIEAALKAKMDRRNSIKYRAMWMAGEHDRRAREQAREGALAAIPAERRAEMASKALQSFSAFAKPEPNWAQLTAITPETEAALTRLGWASITSITSETEEALVKLGWEKPKNDK